MKKLIAGVLATIALFAAVPVLPSSVGFGMTLTASAEGEHTFTGVVKKVIAVGYLITPDSGTDEAGKASQFMVKYSDVDAFAIGDTVTVTYSGNPEVDSNIATVTATNISKGAATTEAKTEAKTEATTTAETTTAAKKDDVVATTTATTTKPAAATSTPATGEGAGVLAVVGVALAAMAIRKKM